MDLVETYEISAPMLKTTDEQKMSRTKQICSAEKSIDEVFGPVLYEFAYWVLKSATFDGVKKLYFLSRDAYPALVVAKEICLKYGINIDCTYFHCSRYSLRLPMYSENVSESLDYICSRGIDVTIDKILVRAGMSWNDLPKDLKVDLCRITNRKAILTISELEQVKKTLMKSKVFKDLLVTKSQIAWPLTCAYFQQEGMLGNDIGVVDSGWVGTTQKSIELIRSRNGQTKSVKGYYFGLYDIPIGEKEDNYKCYYFSPESGWVRRIFFSNCLIEAVFSNKKEGTTIGYVQDENSVVPLLAENNSSLEELMLTDKLISSAIECIYKENGTNSKSILNGVSYNLARLMSRPTKSEAEHLGSISFSDDLLDNDVKQLAPILDRSKLWSNHLLSRFLSKSKIKRMSIHECGWYEASAERSSKLPRIHQYSYVSYKAMSNLLQIVKYRYTHKARKGK